MIELGNGYYLDADNNCWTIFKTIESTNQKTGEKYTTRTHQKYYSDIKHALNSHVKAMVRLQVQKGEIESLEEVVGAIEVEYKRLATMLDGVFPEK